MAEDEAKKSLSILLNGSYIIFVKSLGNLFPNYDNSYNLTVIFVKVEKNEILCKYGTKIRKKNPCLTPTFN